jgi:hypothetical protein
MRLRPLVFHVALAGFLIAVPFAGCRKASPPERARKPVRTAVADDRATVSRFPVGAPLEGQPWIAHVNAVDLDRDGLLDLLVCESRENKVTWVRQVSRGRFEERLVADDMSAPVHVEAEDMDGDGDLDLIVSSMGMVFPNNDRIGSLWILEATPGGWVRHKLLENVARVTDARAADFDGDGRLDLAVGQFGYDQGEVRWMRRTGPWTFESEILLDLSGTVNVCVADFDGNGTKDFAAQVSQQWEEIHLFSNQGGGKFTRKVIWGSTNEDYASSGMGLCDLNRDGRPDLLFSNGDGFGPAAVPGPRPWHGVQWLENTGGGNFRFRRIGDLAGAYSPVEADLDGDGRMDVVAVSAFNTWEDPSAHSMVWYRNEGGERFSTRLLATSPTHLLTLAAGDFDGTGRAVIASGAFHAYPPYDRMSRLLLWRTNLANGGVR